MDSARNDVPHFFQFGPPNEFLQIRQALRAPNQNDFIDAFCALESVERVGNDRHSTEQREELVHPHALTAARGDDDGAQHGNRNVESLKR